jgi:transposase InsO family protein
VIWREPWPGWHVCGIPGAFHVGHGSDFTSAHLEQVIAGPRTRAYFSLPGSIPRPGKVERILSLSVTPACGAGLRSSMASRHRRGVGRPGTGIGRQPQASAELGSCLPFL